MEYRNKLIFGNHYQAFPDAQARDIALSLMGQDVYTSTISVVVWAVSLLQNSILPPNRIEFYYNDTLLDVEANNWPDEMIALKEYRCTQ